MPRTVDVHLGVTNNLLDLSLLFEISKGLAGQAAVDLETVNESGDGDETVGLDVLVEPLSGLLLEDDGVLGLVLDCIGIITLATAHKHSSTIVVEFVASECVRLPRRRNREIVR